jgi:hypothetical protein
MDLHGVLVGVVPPLVLVLTQTSLRLLQGMLETLTFQLTLMEELSIVPMELAGYKLLLL